VPIVTFDFRRRIALSLFCLLLSGCGGSFVDNTVGSVQQTVTRVPYVEWNAYNLYRFQNGDWVPIIAQGEVLGDVPNVGDRPALIVHGLGSDIASGRFNELAISLQQSGVTAVLGFEYDTLDSIAGNGDLLIDALGLLTEENPGLVWRIAAHSMGTLVTRVALESGIPFDVAETGNVAALVAGPHLGSEVADEVQARPNVFQEALQLLVLNGKMEFRNADGARVAVNGQEQGFTDLRTDSFFLMTQNFEAANRHPQFEYRTMAGNARGTDYEALNRLLGVFLDDGVVDVASANATVIGQVQIAVGNADHSTIVEDPAAIVQILQFLGL
jgi:pimeloyl-ACP methyl ester carboxylesterase